jgi:hypothetical protein
LKYYAGIGSRQTPPEILDLMTRVAVKLRKQGYVLRSGHAPGADQAFEKGAEGKAEIFLPWGTFEDRVPIHLDAKVYSRPSPEAINCTKEFHPAWDRCSPGAKLMHSRNAHQILGLHLDSLVEFVVCWRVKQGGTDQAIRIAENNAIPISNFANKGEEEIVRTWLEE